MTDLNHVTLIGRLTRDAELKYTQAGTACTTFSIAVNKSYKKDDTWEERVHFFNCTIWGKYGESMQKHLVKGKQIAIEAELNHNPWTDKNEVRHNDVVLKQFLIGQSKKDDSPFEISDWSIKEASSDWKTKARARIRSSDVVIVICGKNTDTATGVATELSITQEERKDYFLLAGYSDGGNRKPTSARSSDKIYKWTWDNLKALIHGGR